MLNKITSALLLALLAAESSAVQLTDEVVEVADVAEVEDVVVEEDAAAEEEPVKGNNVQVKIAFNVDVKKAHHDDAAVSAREQSIVDALAAAGEALGAAEAGLDEAAADAATADAAADAGAADADADAGADADADADAGADAADEPAGTPTHAHYVLSDATTVNGVDWATLKATAMAEGYTETADYTDLSALDQALVDALIAAQTELGDNEAELVAGDSVEIEYVEPAPEPPVELPTLQLYVSMKDDNTIAGTTWSDWKADAMVFGFEQSTAFTDLSNLDQALLLAHRDAQFATGDNAGALGDGDDVQGEVTWTEDESNDATGTTDVCVYLNDLTEVGGMDWMDLKATAMSADYTSSDDYMNLDPRDVTLVDALIAQQELEDNYNSDLVESIASLEIQSFTA